MCLTETDIKAAKYEGAGNARDVRWDDAPRGLAWRFAAASAAFLTHFEHRIHRASVWRLLVSCALHSGARATATLASEVSGRHPCRQHSVSVNGAVGKVRVSRKSQWDTLDLEGGGTTLQ